MSKAAGVVCFGVKDSYPVGLRWRLKDGDQIEEELSWADKVSAVMKVRVVIGLFYF